MDILCILCDVSFSSIDTLRGCAMLRRNVVMLLLKVKVMEGSLRTYTILLGG